MPSHKKGTRGSVKIKTLKTRGLAGGKAAKVKGGIDLSTQSATNSLQEATEQASKTEKQRSDLIKSIITNTSSRF